MACGEKMMPYCYPSYILKAFPIFFSEKKEKMINTVDCKLVAQSCAQYPSELVELS